MAVCQTIRTKIDIAKFLIQSENGDEHVTAFMYKDKKVEVQSLKADCAPLYLEEDTSVELVSHNTIGKLLVSFTPKQAFNTLDIRVWQVAGIQGFQPKDVYFKLSDKKDGGKVKYPFSVENFLAEELTQVSTASINSLLCLILNGKKCLIFNVHVESNGILFDLTTSFPLNEGSPVSQAMFLKTPKAIYLVLVETTTLNVLMVSNDELSPSVIVNVSMKKSQGTSISHLYKITSSKCLVIDNVGHVSLYCAPNELTTLKFPSSIGGHSICSSVGFKHTTEGILAICNNDYTINFYLLADILCSVTEETSVYVKPYRVFCSQFPINAISFIKSDQLALVSAVNQSITFLGGFSKHHT